MCFTGILNFTRLDSFNCLVLTVLTVKHLKMFENRKSEREVQYMELCPSVMVTLDRKHYPLYACLNLCLTHLLTFIFSFSLIFVRSFCNRCRGNHLQFSDQPEPGHIQSRRCSLYTATGRHEGDTETLVRQLGSVCTATT